MSNPDPRPIPLTANADVENLNEGDDEFMRRLREAGIQVGSVFQSFEAASEMISQCAEGLFVLNERSPEKLSSGSKRVRFSCSHGGHASSKSRLPDNVSAHAGNDSFIFSNNLFT
jgi:hypothetical protein